MNAPPSPMEVALKESLSLMRKGYSAEVLARIGKTLICEAAGKVGRLQAIGGVLNAFDEIVGEKE